MKGVLFSKGVFHSGRECFFGGRGHLNSKPQKKKNHTSPRKQKKNPHFNVDLYFLGSILAELEAGPKVTWIVM